MFYKVITGFQELGLNNYILHKAEGMLRFHLHGQLPLAEQDWPDCLAPKKKEWLTKLHQLGS
jgi:hypothetical protein